MINKLVIENSRGEILDLVLSDAGKSTGFIVTDITGIDAGSVTVYTRERGSYDGGISGSSRKGTRNIVITLQYLEIRDIEKLRHQLYAMFPLKGKINLTIHGDDRISGISGIVESMDSEIFGEKTFAQISVLCTDPYFLSKDISKNTENLFYGSEPMFEFPFSNEKWTEIYFDQETLTDKQDPIPDLIFGDIHDIGIVNIYYEGDVETGMIMEITTLENDIGKIELYNSSLRQKMILDTELLFINNVRGSQPGDTLTVSSISGSKGVILLRKGVTYNVFNIIDLSSDWVTLDSGDNMIGFNSEKGADKLVIKVTNDTLYVGV